MGNCLELCLPSCDPEVRRIEREFYEEFKIDTKLPPHGTAADFRQKCILRYFLVFPNCNWSFLLRMNIVSTYPVPKSPTHKLLHIIRID